jgi:hypothetical protein
MVEKRRGLTAIVGSYQKNINFGGKEICLRKIQQKQMVHLLRKHHIKYPIESVNYGNFQMLAKESDMMDTGIGTIGPKEVFFGTSLIGKTIC